MAQVALVESSQPDGEVGSVVAVSWTVCNVGDETWDEATIKLYKKSGLEAPISVPVPLLAPGEIAEVGTEALLGSEEGAVSLTYHLEVWGGMDGAIVGLNYSGNAKKPCAPVPEIAAKLVYAEAAADLTSAQDQTLLEMYDVTQVVAVQVKNGCMDAILRNTGSKSWPKGCALQLIGGAAACGTERVEFDYAIEAGEMIHVGLQFAGDASSRWVFCTPEGKTFGCLIEVLNQTATDDSTEDKEKSVVVPGPQHFNIGDEAAAPDAEMDEWEEVENADLNLAMCVTLAHLRQKGYEDDNLNAFLLDTYRMDVDKVERLLEVMRTESLRE
jgi:hypothetical protein